MFLFIDFETQSETDLKKVDVVNYVNHPSTKVICCAYYLTDDPSTFDADKVQLTWFDFPSLPNEYQNLTVIAHNASFEQAVIQRFFPEFLSKVGRWIDTMALASINNVRRSLAQACGDCQIPLAKYSDGAMVMRKLNSSKNTIEFDDLTQTEIEDLAKYCKQDIILTAALFNKLKSTYTKQEQEVWSFTNRHNWKGVPIDVELAQKGMERTIAWQEKLPKLVTELTNGAVTSINQVAKLGQYLGLENVRADAIIQKIKTEKDPTKITLMKLRIEGGKKSVSKYEAAVNKSRDGKLYHTLDYHAAATGRFASTGVQLQNLIKADKEEAEAVIADLKAGVEWDPASTISKASKAIRGLFIPHEGHDLLKADYSQIEARILAWLVGDTTLLKEFASGGKIYEQMAAKIFNINYIENVTPEQRFYGKVAVLGCGYGMGATKFQLTFNAPEDIAQKAINAYRNANRKVVNFWYDLEKAVLATVDDGFVRKLNKLTVWRDSWRLFIKLPSGRNLVYPYPKIKDGKIYHKTRKQGQFVEVSYWGGTFVENVCQGISRDLLVEALLHLEKFDTYTFLFTVHDELVYSAPTFCYDPKEFSRLIIDSAPSWAEGLPLAVETETYHRYFK